jgi:hypothetical protein
MYYLIRWLTGKLRRRTTSPAGTPVAVPAGTSLPSVREVSVS